MKSLALLIAIVTSVLNTVQAGANAQLNKSLGNVLAGALAVYLAGLVVILIAMGGALLLPQAGASLRAAFGNVGEAPWWAWTGGVLGLTYVFAMLLFADKLGAAVFSSVTLAAAMITSVALDHFALVGFREHPVSAGRVAGCLLLAGGAFLIARF